MQSRILLFKTNRAERGRKSRALLEAWTSGDKRAEAIVAEWLEKKEAE